MSAVYPCTQWVDETNVVGGAVLDIVDNDGSALVATRNGMCKLSETYNTSLKRIKGVPYWAARAAFESVHKQRTIASKTGQTTFLSRSTETGRWVAKSNCAAGKAWKVSATKFKFDGDLNDLQLCSARSSAMLGVTPADAMLLHNETDTTEYYDTFNGGAVCVFGMPLSDNPTFAACSDNQSSVFLVAVRAVAVDDDLTLPTLKARKQLQLVCGEYKILATTPTPPHVAMSACPIPPLTQVVTTDSDTIRSVCNLSKVTSLRCVIGTKPITQADIGAVPANVQVLQFVN